MKPFIKHKGISVPVMNDDIDTDQLLPKQYLKRVERTGYGDFLLEEWRYLPGPERKENPDFIMNWPEYREASIIITGENFGAGSSREHAVWALNDYGIRCVIGGSFGDIFYMNSLKNGMLAITLPEDERQYLARIPAGDSITLDLVEQIVQHNDKIFKFDIDSEWRHKLLHGIDDISETMEYEKAIEAYEKKWDPIQDFSDKLHLI